MSHFRSESGCGGRLSFETQRESILVERVQIRIVLFVRIQVHIDNICHDLEEPSRTISDERREDKTKPKILRLRVIK